MAAAPSAMSPPPECSGVKRLRDSGGGLALYGVTLALELPAVWVRAYLAYAVAWFWSQTQDMPAAYRWPIAALFAFAPLAWSASALVWPGASGIWWRQRIGGRAPTEHERRLYDAADLPEAPRWFVLDDAYPRAAVCGDALMLTRGMLEDRDLAGVLAHELGHLDTLDARLTAALDNLVLWTPRARGGRRGAMRSLGAAVLWIVRGGVGARLTERIWARWWREREYVADAYAAAVGRGEELRSYLNRHVLLDDRPVPFMWASAVTHPPTAERIERLSRQSDGFAAEPPRDRPERVS
jgi:Zn-dependent protease with chaperone function